MSSKYAWIAAITLTIGFIIGSFTTWTIDSKPTHTKQPVDHDRYYCHETGFLMHHFQMQKDGPYMDMLIDNRWDEPIKCQDGQGQQ